MLKKLFIGLAPLLAVVALAVMPVAAQAVNQHWYSNGVIMPSGEVSPFVLWGNEINLNLHTEKLGEVNCRTTGAGTIENLGGGQPGAGSLTALTFYECKAPFCEEDILKKTGLPGRLWPLVENIPAAVDGISERRFTGWFLGLQEQIVEGVNSVRLAIGEEWLKFQTPSPAGMIRIALRCEIAATGQVGSEPILEGELKPEIGVAKLGNLNGTSAGAPSQIHFQEADGFLHSVEAGLSTFNAGNLKYLGYNHQELITVKP
jgi:hypothetical protein